jgi:hypothetical protein
MGRGQRFWLPAATPIQVSSICSLTPSLALTLTRRLFRRKIFEFCLACVQDGGCTLAGPPPPQHAAGSWLVRGSQPADTIPGWVGGWVGACLPGCCLFLVACQ